MNFLRALLASLFSLICSIAVAAFVILITLQTTILDRNEAKTWARNSGVYQTALTTTIDSDPATQQQIEDTPIPLDTLKTALNQTFPPDYVQGASENIINNTYDWLDGNESTIAFQVNTTEKKDEFVNNLARLIEPQIAALPRCASIAAFSVHNPTCIPPGYTARQLAGSLATDAGNSVSIFHQPITDETLAEAQQDSQSSISPSIDNPTTQKLPELVSNADMWAWLLPLVAVTSGGLMVLLSQHKLIAAKRLVGKLTFSLIFTTVIGVVIAALGKSFKAADWDSNPNLVLQNIIEPIIHQAIPAIGTRLAWVSGISAMITGAVWITLKVIKQRREQVAPPVLPEIPIPSKPTDNSSNQR